MELRTLEKRIDLEDTEGQTPEEIRYRMRVAAEMGGYDTNVTTNQTVLIEVNDSAVGSKRIGSWDE